MRLASAGLISSVWPQNASADAKRGGTRWSCRNIPIRRGFWTMTRKVCARGRGMMARYEIGGCVYSMAHGWGPNPYENLQSFAGTHGDGTLLYPGEPKGVKGPLPSLRLMLLREAHQETRLLQNLDATTRDKLARFVAPSPIRLPDDEFARRVALAQKWLLKDEIAAANSSFEIER